MKDFSNLLFGPTGQLTMSLAGVGIVGARFIAHIRDNDAMVRASADHERHAPLDTTSPLMLDATPVADPRRAALPARVRIGRLPLPRRVLELNASDEPALDVVNAFVDRLAELPFEQWIEIGRSVAAGTPDVDERSTAWASMTEAISTRQLGVAAWYVRDAVETAAFVAQSRTNRLSSQQRRCFAAAHGAAEDAALAVLSRAYLHATAFEILTSTFRGLVMSAPPDV